MWLKDIYRYRYILTGKNLAWSTTPNLEHSLYSPLFVKNTSTFKIVRLSVLSELHSKTNADLRVRNQDPDSSKWKLEK